MFIVENELELEPEAKVEPKPEVGNEFKPNIEFKPEPNAESEPKPESKNEPEIKIEFKHEPKTEAKPEPEAENEPEPNIEKEREPKSENEPEQDVEYETEQEEEIEHEPNVQNESEPEVKSEPEPKIQIEFEPEIVSKTEKTVENELEPKEQVELEPEQESESETVAENDVEPKVQNEPEHEMKNQSKPKSDFKPDSEVRIELEKENESKPALEIPQETEVGNKPSLSQETEANSNEKTGLNNIIENDLKTELELPKDIPQDKDIQTNVEDVIVNKSESSTSNESNPNSAPDEEPKNSVRDQPDIVVGGQEIFLEGNPKLNDEPILNDGKDLNDDVSIDSNKKIEEKTPDINETGDKLKPNDDSDFKDNDNLPKIGNDSEKEISLPSNPSNENFEPNIFPGFSSETGTETFSDPNVKKPSENTIVDWPLDTFRPVDPQIIFEIRKSTTTTTTTTTSTTTTSKPSLIPEKSGEENLNSEFLPGIPEDSVSQSVVPKKGTDINNNQPNIVIEPLPSNPNIKIESAFQPSIFFNSQLDFIPQYRPNLIPGRRLGQSHRDKTGSQVLLEKSDTIDHDAFEHEFEYAPQNRFKIKPDSSLIKPSSSPNLEYFLKINMTVIQTEDSAIEEMPHNNLDKSRKSDMIMISETNKNETFNIENKNTSNSQHRFKENFGEKSVKDMNRVKESLNSLSQNTTSLPNVKDSLPVYDSEMYDEIISMTDNKKPSDFNDGTFSFESQIENKSAIEPLSPSKIKDNVKNEDFDIFQNFMSDDLKEIPKSELDLYPQQVIEKNTNMALTQSELNFDAEMISSDINNQDTEIDRIIENKKILKPSTSTESSENNSVGIKTDKSIIKSETLKDSENSLTSNNDQDIDDSDLLKEHNTTTSPKNTIESVEPKTTLVEPTLNVRNISKLIEIRQPTPVTDREEKELMTLRDLVYTTMSIIGGTLRSQASDSSQFDP